MDKKELMCAIQYNGNNTGQPNNDNRTSTVNHSNEGVGKLIQVLCSDGKG